MAQTHGVLRKIPKPGNWLESMPEVFEDEDEIKAFADHWGISFDEVMAELFGEEFNPPNEVYDPHELPLVEKKGAVPTFSKKKKKRIVVNDDEPTVASSERMVESSGVKDLAQPLGKGKRARAYAITDFELDLSFWQSIADTQKVDYIIIAEEICSSTSRVHWQGFIYFTNPRTESAVFKLLSPRHVERCYGDARSNIIYCRKGNQDHDEWENHRENGPTYGKDFKLVFEHGEEPSGKGSRTDLEQIWDSIKRGELKTPEEICDLNPSAYVRYSRSFDRLLGFFCSEKVMED